LKHYAYCNPEALLPNLIEQTQKDYFALFNMDTINTGDSATVQKAIQAADVTVKQTIKNSFDELYHANFMDFHIWLFDNVDNIKKSYDQGADTNRNLGGGTCLRDSLDRDKILAQNPTIPSDQIHMGSSAQGRFAQSREEQEVDRINRVLKQVANGEVVLTDDEMRAYLGALDRLEEQELQQLKLKKTATIDVSLDTGNPTLPLMAAIDNVYNNNGKNIHCVLTLTSPNGVVGHAINFQLDASGKMFRFFDDNLGIDEYATYEQFKSEFEKYIKTAYEDLTKFGLRFYQSIP
jgi:hypothetical protein